MKNLKTKISIGTILSISMLFGLFAFATPASAMTCNSATLTGTVITGTPPAHARFEYSTDSNTVSSGGGTPTTVQVFNTDGTFPMQQFISGLTEDTTYYYRIAVTNNYGIVNGAVLNFTTPTCTQIQTPTVTLNANPSTINSGNSSTLTWNSTNATSCSSYWTGSTATSGSGVVYPTGTTTYSVTCTNSTGQSASASATVYVNGIQNQTCTDYTAINYGGLLPCRYQQNNLYPTVTMYASPSTVNYNGSSTVTWYSTNATYCTATGGTNSWYGSQNLSGSFYTGAITGTTTFSINCSNSVGNAVASTTIYTTGIINPVSYQPTVGISADQTTVNYNGATNIRWSTTNSTSCNATGGSIGWAGAKSIGPGSFYTGSLTGTRTYSITCTNNVGSATDSVTVYVRGQVLGDTTTRTPSSYLLVTTSVDRNRPIVPTLDNTNPCPGDEINYTITYQNVGNGSITGLVLRIDMPGEVTYMSSTPNAPMISGQTLIFNLGTLGANKQGTVTAKMRVRDNVSAGTPLNFPATLNYVDPSGSAQSVNANVSANVCGTASGVNLGANVFGAGFLPTSILGWLILIILILLLILLAKYIFNQPFQKRTVVMVDQNGNDRTTTTTSH